MTTAATCQKPVVTADPNQARCGGRLEPTGVTSGIWRYYRCAKCGAEAVEKRDFAAEERPRAGT